MQVSVAEIEAEPAALTAHAGAWQAAEVSRAVARAEETARHCGLYYLESYCVQPPPTGRRNRRTCRHNAAGGGGERRRAVRLCPTGVCSRAPESRRRRP